MGGPGSGRYKDPVKALTNTPIAQYGEELVVLPDYSGVSSHAKTLAAFDDRYHQVDQSVIPSSDANLNIGSALATYNTLYINRIIGYVPLLYQFQGARVSPADGSTYFIGADATSSSTSANIQRIYFQNSGKIMQVVINVKVAGTLGSNEEGTASVQINGSTAYTITSALTANSAYNSWTVDMSSQNINVTTSDYFEIRIIWPTWVTTNPTNTSVTGSVLVV